MFVEFIPIKALCSLDTVIAYFVISFEFPNIEKDYKKTNPSTQAHRGVDI